MVVTLLLLVSSF